MQIASIDPVQLVQLCQRRRDICQAASQEFAADAGLGSTEEAMVPWASPVLRY